MPHVNNNKINSLPSSLPLYCSAAPLNRTRSLLILPHHHHYDEDPSAAAADSTQLLLLGHGGTSSDSSHSICNSGRSSTSASSFASSSPITSTESFSFASPRRTMSAGVVVGNSNSSGRSATSSLTRRGGRASVMMANRREYPAWDCSQQDQRHDLQHYHTSSSPAQPRPPLSRHASANASIGSGSAYSGGGSQTYSSNLQYNNNSYSSSSSNNSNHHYRLWMIGIVFLGGFFFCGIWIGCYMVGKSLLLSHDENLKQHVRQIEFIPLSRELEHKLTLLEKENQNLQVRLLDHFHHHSEKEDSSNNHQIDHRLRREIESLHKQTASYRHSVHKLSKYALMERFGTGPYYVQMQLAFDPATTTTTTISSSSDSSDSRKQDNAEATTTTTATTFSILLQMAPANEMPLSVFWFLEQVTRGLYDGCSIYQVVSSTTTTTTSSSSSSTNDDGTGDNAMTMIQGGPTATNFLTLPGGDPLDRFVKSGFGPVLLPEYHEHWSSLSSITANAASASFVSADDFTICYATTINESGEHIGPDFYIQGQQHQHQPQQEGKGQQIQRQQQQQGKHGSTVASSSAAVAATSSSQDPCFGKVIAGLDVIHRIHHLPKQQQQQQQQQQDNSAGSSVRSSVALLQHNVAITAMRMIHHDDPLLEQLQQQQQS